MGARDPWKAVVVWGCPIVSGLLVSLMGSWGAFRGLLVVTTVGRTCAGVIRTHPEKEPGGGPDALPSATAEPDGCRPPR